jgi:hypothetical protein
MISEERRMEAERDAEKVATIVAEQVLRDMGVTVDAPYTTPHTTREAAFRAAELATKFVLLLDELKREVKVPKQADKPNLGSAQAFFPGGDETLLVARGGPDVVITRPMDADDPDGYGRFTAQALEAQRTGAEGKI